MYVQVWIVEFRKLYYPWYRTRRGRRKDEIVGMTDDKSILGAFLSSNFQHKLSSVDNHRDIRNHPLPALGSLPTSRTAPCCGHVTTMSGLIEEDQLCILRDNYIRGSHRGGGEQQNRGVREGEEDGGCCVVAVTPSRYSGLLAPVYTE